MRTWREFLQSLTRSPRGFSADGRTLGLGLATAMAKARQAPAVAAEQFLRERAADEQRAAA
jgi:hypothetical protein